jgi:hypothetical protein
MKIFIKLLPFFVVEYLAFATCPPLYVTGVFSNKTDVVVNPFRGVYFVYRDEDKLSES